MIPTMIQKPRYTMRDVARLAGVSIATVSAVVNGTSIVSPARTKQVRDAMIALDYHPDQVARSLKTGRTDVIGMILPDITNAFFPEVVRGAEEAAHEHGYSVILCNSNEDPSREQRHLNTLFSRRVDGVLIACSDNSTAYESLVRQRFPLVFVDRVPQGVRSAAVSTDNVEAGYMATNHLIGLGHTRIAMIAGNLRLSPHAHRLEGFRRAMQEHQLPISGDHLRIGDLRTESGLQAGRELLNLGVPPTAVISSNNKMLLGLMRAISEAGVRCPDEVSVIGFDDHVWTENFSPKLTIVAQPTYEIGRRAIDLLLKKMQPGAEDGSASEIVLLQAELRVRESTASPALPNRRAEKIKTFRKSP
jgi:LacI family transcriptional regulator